MADKPRDATYSLIELKNFGKESKSQKQLKEEKNQPSLDHFVFCFLEIVTCLFEQVSQINQ